MNSAKTQQTKAVLVITIELLKVANGSFRKTKHKNGPIYF
jgi:hypothetical protein